VANFREEPDCRVGVCYPTQFRPITCPGSLAEDPFRPEKEGMARVFAVMVQILLSITRVVVQVL